MPPETISKYGSRGLTPEQTANEATAQAIRFGTPAPTATPTPETKSYSTTPELTAMSIANSPTAPTSPKRTIKTPSTPTMPTYEDAYKAESRNAQKEINLLNQYAAEQLASLQPRQEERLRETSSVNTLTGLAGSTEANRTTEKTTAVNQKENDLVRAEAAMKAQQILGNVSTKAIARAKEAREGFTAQYEMDQATKLAKQTEDFNEAITLAQSGVDLNAYKTQDPEAYSYLAESLGGEEMLKATFTLNRPKETILDKKIEGGKYIISYQNPIDGKVRIETVDLGLPVGYSKTIDAGNRILAIPDDWDGDPAKLVTINKGLTPGQAATAAGGSAGSGGGTVAATGVVARDADSIMSGALNLNDVSTAKNYRSEVAAELNRRIKTATETGDIYGTMKASASYDKEPSDTFLQSMEKTISVMEQLGVLQQNIAGTDTGPLMGAFRSANPWDDNAQTIKAQLSAIVPNLARGVYGEVGVLTDADVRTYSKTIPTLNSTEDVRNAVLYITIDMIKRNIETKIKNQAAGQRDMSGYADIYKQVQNTANQILATLPKSSKPGSQSGVLKSPDGTQQVNVSDLTPEELEEARNLGWI